MENAEQTNNPNPGEGNDVQSNENLSGDNTPEQVPADSPDQAPGTGIDTNGDGNADEIVEPEKVPDAHIDSPEDYENKVRLSDNMGDVISKNSAYKLLKASNINEHYKAIMRKQIKDGQLQYPYNEAFKRVKQADENNAIYRPGADGL